MAKAISAGFITDKINGIAVNASLKCNTSNYNNRDSRSVAYIVMHYTGNAKDTAKNNATYFTGDNRAASAHFFVDDADIYQSVELRDIAWHCGTKGTYYHTECRNTNSFGIEMCCTAGNYKISETTKKNAAYLCAHLCKLIGVSASQVDKYVLRHYDITHKKCPAQMVDAESEWTAFKTMVKNVLTTGNVSGTKPATVTAKPAADAKKKKITAWQKAAIADGFKFPKYGADGAWGSECEAVAKKAICKKQLVYKNKNLTKFLQEQLGITADGKFGSGTKTAVTNYQKKNKLTADGIVGLNTWKKILGV